MILCCLRPIAILRPRLAAMSSSSYEGWSREKLIERLAFLESQQSTVPSASPTVPTPTCLPQKNMHTKSFNFHDHPRRKIALKFCYSGWEYGGLAFQLGQTPFPTVEGVLFDALAKAHLIDPDANFEGCGWEKCGRTDRGVSAAGQVVTLWVRSALPRDQLPAEDPKIVQVVKQASVDDEAPTLSPQEPKQGKDLNDGFASSNIEDSLGPNPPTKKQAGKRPVRGEHDYLSILNRLLPDTIRVIAWSPVSSSFSARFSCIYRHYKFFFSPLGLDIPRMQDAAARLVGLHDFRNLCKLDPGKQITIFMRTVSKAEIEPLNDDVFVFNLVGSAFLYHQVRHIMSVLFLVGSGLELPAVVSSLLNVASGSEPLREGDTEYDIVDCKPDYQMADALPLMLWECGYPEKELSWRTTGRLDDSGLAVGGELYHQLQSIHARSQIYTTLNQHFFAAASEHHPPPKELFPLVDRRELEMKKNVKDPMNVPLGGGTFKRFVKYIPLLERKRLDPVEVANERWRLGKGSRKEPRKKGARTSTTAESDGNE